MNRMLKIQHVVIIVNLLKPEAIEILDEITDFFRKRNISFEIFKYEGNPIEFSVDKGDLAISLGGDGTVLFCARRLAELNIPIMAVNLGNFGFITEVGMDEWKETFNNYENGILGYSRRLMLQVTVSRNGRIAETFSSLNDAVISAMGISKLIRLRVDLRDTQLGKYRADGLIVSTPTGSTAYSAAAGGPLLDPELDAMIINPICPFTLSNRPLVVQSEDEINVMVEDEQRAEIILTIDGQQSYKLEPGDQIKFKSSRQKALIIKSGKRNFFEVIRNKLKWSGGPDA